MVLYGFYAGLPSWKANNTMLPVPLRCGNASLPSPTSQPKWLAATSVVGSWLAGPQCAQGIAAIVLEWFDTRLNFEDLVTNRRKAVGLARLRERFGFDDAGPVGERKKFHRLACDLMMRALLDDEATCCDCLADEFTEAIHRAVCIPRHIGEQFKRIAVDGETKQVGFRFQSVRGAMVH